MARMILFNKPWGVLSQFSGDSAEGRRPLRDFIAVPGVYPAGRLDRDSEGLLLLTDDGALQARISNPAFRQEKTYLVQVEGLPDDAALQQLAQGVLLKDGMTAPARIDRIAAPDLWPRDPPIRHRPSIPDCWLQLTITEGRNRQVRRMTAAVGHPTLRLVRWRIGDWTLDGLTPGEWREVALPSPPPRPAASKGPKTGWHPGGGSGRRPGKKPSGPPSGRRQR